MSESYVTRDEFSHLLRRVEVLETLVRGTVRPPQEPVQRPAEKPMAEPPASPPEAPTTRCSSGSA